MSEMTAWAGKSDDSGSRWVHVGRSWDDNSRGAGLAAATMALRAPDPRLLVVLASSTHDLASVLEGVDEAAGGTPTIGCSTAGEIGPGVEVSPQEGPGVLVLCLGGAFVVSTAHAPDLAADPREAGVALASALSPIPRTRYRFALLLTDTFAGDQQEMIRGVYGVLGPTLPLLGAGASNHDRTRNTWQFHGREVHTNSVVGALVGTDSPIGISVRHGWRHQGDPFVVTSCEGYSLLTLDDKPALDIYLDRHDAPAGIETDPARFAAFTLTRPLAVARRGDVAIRQVLSADPLTRSIVCAMPIPRGALAWLAVGDSASALEAADIACAEAVDQLLEISPLGLIIFDCEARRLIFDEDDTPIECQYMLARAGSAPVAGFYTYGEIARIRGVHAYHNQTIVALALS